METQCVNNQPHMPNESNICITCGLDITPHTHDYIVADDQGKRSCLCGETMPIPEVNTITVDQTASVVPSDAVTNPVSDTLVTIPAAEDPNRNDKGQFVEGNTVDGNKNDKTGRPTVVTPAVLELLRQAFLIGCTDAEAALNANIGVATLYNYQKANPDFLELKEQWKENPLLKARNTIYNNLDKPDTAKWYAERKNKDEFSSRHELTGKDGADLPPVKIEYVIPTITRAEPATSADTISSDPEATPSVVVVDGSGN